MTETRVVDNPQAGRFDIIVDGERAGLVAYRRSDSRIEFTHTRIDPKFQGHGFGSVLVKEALDAARADSLAVLPSCSFVRRYIARHKQYLELVPPDERPRFDLTG